ncbi:phytoene/squalene synthase family protein [Roseococcus sp. YIM B11640]|uniref:phytoene/squalene synthase family protein n=1 Tax=Roseococcus sp. YIM B11640 TaxID=3133973 RepID=UPI003C7E98E5
MPELSPCGAIARRHDPDRFFCALFAPAERREALFTLIAFNHELARAREVASHPMLALMRLTWWREAVEEAVAGRPVRQHEVAAPLHAAIRTGELDAEGLIAMAEAREAETDEEGIETTAALHSYLRGTAGGFAVVAGRLLGAPPALLPGLQQAGMLYGLAGLLRAVPALAAQERCLLPRELIMPEVVIADPREAGPVVRQLAQGAPAPPDLKGLPRAAMAAALPLTLGRRDLRRLARGAEVSRGVSDRIAVLIAAIVSRP